MHTKNMQNAFENTKNANEKSDGEKGEIENNLKIGGKRKEPEEKKNRENRKILFLFFFLFSGSCFVSFCFVSFQPLAGNLFLCRNGATPVSAQSQMEVLTVCRIAHLVTY